MRQGRWNRAKSHQWPQLPSPRQISQDGIFCPRIPGFLAGSSHPGPFSPCVPSHAGEGADSLAEVTAPARDLTLAWPKPVPTVRPEPRSHSGRVPGVPARQQGGGERGEPKAHPSPPTTCHLPPPQSEIGTSKEAEGQHSKLLDTLPHAPGGHTCLLSLSTSSMDGWLMLAESLPSKLQTLGPFTPEYSSTLPKSEDALLNTAAPSAHPV